MNKRVVNTTKTKIMIYHRGRLPVKDKDFCFKFDTDTLERVSEFCYLGFTFSQQLSFTSHAQKVVAKAKKQIGILNQHLKIRSLGLSIVLRLFEVYVVPVFRYGAGLWLSSCSNASIIAIDAVFTKYLKAYLGIPKHCNNSIVYYVTGTIPLSVFLRSQVSSFTNGLTYPSCLAGIQFNFLKDTRAPEPFSAIEKIPTTFWRSKPIYELPRSYYYRRQLCRDATDQIHSDICNTKTFHVSPSESCICSLCNEKADSYHHYVCQMYKM